MAATTESPYKGTPEVAQETLSYCTSCKMDLAHTIVSMKGDKIAKVECKTCQKTHIYRAPKGITEPRKSKKSADGAPTDPKTIEAEWEKLMSAQKAQPAKTYAFKSQFKLGDKINHPSFGEGIVHRVIFPNKIEVIFRTDLKLLVHGGHPAP